MKQEVQTLPDGSYTGRMKASIRVLVLLLLMALALGACGNKGDLVLPDAPDTPKAATADPPPAQ